MSTRASKKIEVARGLDRVTDYINKGPLVPFSGGGLLYIMLLFPH